MLKDLYQTDDWQTFWGRITFEMNQQTSFTRRNGVTAVMGPVWYRITREVSSMRPITARP